jgi:putative drug exporter of the RND superfamily
MTRLAQFAVRRPAVVLICWGIGVLILAGIGRGVEEKLLPTQLLVPGTETDRWHDLRKGHFGEDAAVLLRGPKEAIDRQGPPLARALANRENTRAISPWSAGEEAERLRPSGEQALIVLDLDIPRGQNQSTIIPPLERFIDDRVSPPLEPHLSGLSPLGRDINEATTDSIHRAELLAFPVLIIVLLLVFRSPVAAAIPLIVALGTTQAGFGVIELITGFADLDAIALSLASMIGLALGVDYSLLIVTRFRETLEEDHTVRQAASLAANTAGRTAIFAGVVLIAIMLVSFFLSPGTVLLSSSVGAIVVAVLSMVGAALVTPAAVTLLGTRVNMWAIGGKPKVREGAGLIHGVVGRVSRRPALAAMAVLAGLLLLAAPVLAIDTIPPDPRQLPEDSQGLEDFREVRKAGFGPSVDVVLAAPHGAVTDPSRLRAINRLESRLGRVPYVKFVVGPGTVGEQTEDLRKAPKKIDKGKRQLEEGKRELADAENDLTAAAEGVEQLREQLLFPGAAGASEIASGANRLSGGSSQLAAGANRVAAGNRLAASRTSNALVQLDQAIAGARQLRSGLTRAREGSEQVAAGSSQLRDSLSGQLAPGAEQLAAGLRQGQAQLNALRVPAQVTENQLRAASNTLSSLTVGASDPLFPQLLQQINTALAAATGPGGGLDASIGQAAAQAGAGADAADQIAFGARDAASGADRLADGAGSVASGLRQLEGGAGRLERGLVAGRRSAAADASGLDRLAAGAARLAAGAGQFDSGLGRIAAGSSQLAGGLQEGAERTGPLEGGLRQGRDEVALVRMQLLTQTGPFRGLRDLEELERKSPGFFRSGFVTVAALDGARQLPKRESLFLVDSNKGGDVARINVLPDVPTNDPRTEVVVDDIRNVVEDFEDETGTRAAAGGAAGQLVDYDRVTSGRIPLLVICISLVTYLMLVPILRSLFLPMIAVALNLVTVAVGFGVLTLLFVGDNPPLGGAGALDVISVAGIFAITFALSIDYQVFLLTRMREEFVRTQSNDKAIEFGIDKTAKVVTGAAAIMVAVFVAFAMSEFVIIKQFGVGLATCVLIDATIVRLALLPAVMRLFGLNTWWIPNWLDDKLPLLDVEGAEFEHETEQLRPRGPPEPPPPPAALPA